VSINKTAWLSPPLNQYDYVVTAFGVVKLQAVSRYMDSLSKDWRLFAESNKMHPDLFIGIDKVMKAWPDVAKRIEAYAKAHYELGMTSEMVL
jgi:hypothetical protein